MSDEYDDYQCEDGYYDYSDGDYGGCYDNESNDYSEQD